MGQVRASQSAAAGAGPLNASAPDLAIIIVSYNVRELLRRCLESLVAALEQAPLRAEIVVVDNASQDGSADMVAAAFAQVRVIALQRNLGFAGGNNVALRHCLAAPQPPRAVLLLNPDTEVVGDALQRLLRYLDDHPQVAVVGPQLRYADGTFQSSRRRFPSIGTLFWESTLLEQWWPANPWARRYRYDDQPVTEPVTVDWLVGAALLVRTTAIQAAGLLDEGFFLYAEELEWQHRLARHGAIVYLPTAVICHHEGKSSEQNLARRHIEFNRAKLRYARQRWGGVVAWLLRAFLLASYTIQLSIETAKWLLGHKRALRRARIVQYGAVLRSGL